MTPYTCTIGRIVGFLEAYNSKNILTEFLLLKNSRCWRPCCWRILLRIPAIVHSKNSDHFLIIFALKKQKPKNLFSENNPRAYFLKTPVTLYCSLEGQSTTYLFSSEILITAKMLLWFGGALFYRSKSHNWQIRKLGWLLCIGWMRHIAEKLNFIFHEVNCFLKGYPVTFLWQTQIRFTHFHL